MIIKKIAFNTKGELSATYSPDGFENISLSKIEPQKWRELRACMGEADIAFTAYLQPQFPIELTGFKKKVSDGQPFYQLFFSANLNGISKRRN